MAAAAAFAGVATTASRGRRTPYSSSTAAAVASSTGPEAPRNTRSAFPRFACAAIAGTARARTCWYSSTAAIAFADARCPCRNGSCFHFFVKAFASSV